MTNFHTDIHTNIVYSSTGFYVIIYFQSEVIAKKYVGNTAFDGVRRNFMRTVQARTPKFYTLPKACRDIRAYIPDMTSPAASGQRLSKFENG